MNCFIEIFIKTEHVHVYISDITNELPVLIYRCKSDKYIIIIMAYQCCFNFDT